MAQGKKSVLIYVEWMSIFEELDDAEAGKLIKHLFRYVNDLNPEPPDRLTKLVFEPIKLALKRDLQKWEIKSESRSESGRLGGLKSGETRRLKALKNEANEANEAIGSNSKQNEANEAVKVKVKDKVNVNVKEKENSSPKNGEVDNFYITKSKRKLTGRRLESFLVFWKMFNYPKGKSEAADAWLDIPQLTSAICDKIYAAAESEANLRKELIVAGKTPKMAQGWITSRRWEDEIYSKQNNYQKNNQQVGPIIPEIT